MLEMVLITYIGFSGLLLGIWHRRTPKAWFVRWIIVSALPIIGWLHPIMWPRSLKSSTIASQTALFADGLEPSLWDDGLYTGLDTRRELNVVSIEEALYVSDYTARRKVMIDILKHDSLQYIEVVKQAINNEDSETSHYAASAVTELKRRLALSLQELAVAYEENKDDPQVLQSYADVISRYMNSGFLDERTILKYRYTYLQVLEQLIEYCPEHQDAYKKKIDAELRLGRYQEAEATSQMYLTRFPDQEEAYLALIEVYYEMRAHDKLQTILKALKQSSIRLSNHALTIVRFWDAGVRRSKL